MPDFMDPFAFNVPRMMTSSELVAALRVDIAAEIEAINIYEAHANATDNEEARRVLAHVIAEEKEHLAEFLEMVKRLDPEQVSYLEEAPADVAAIVAGQPGADSDSTPVFPPSSASPALPVPLFPSVGSLLDRARRET